MTDHSYEELDTSWIVEAEHQYQNIQEKKPLESINCYFVYIGSDKTIRKVIKETEKLIVINDNVGILNTRLLYIIQNKKYMDNGQRYKISSLVKYVIDIDSKHVYDFNHSTDTDILNMHFLKETSFLENIIVEPSLLMFHSFASLYFFLREDETILQSVRSILKTTPNNRHSITKKVCILENLPIQLTSNKKTKKIRDS